jgi:hypothetical protein
MDRLTKALLAAIAVGLWLNAVNPWIRPRPVEAQMEYLGSINSTVALIQTDLSTIQRGVCANNKICTPPKK